MPLTLDWWEKQKKLHGKGAPALGLTPALKKYEKAYSALQKTKNLDNYNAANKALNDLDEVRKNGAKELDKNYEKWKNLYGVVASEMDTAVKKAKKELAEIENEIALASKIEKAGSELEAQYEINWDGFEKVRDGLKTTQDRGDYEVALAMLGKLKSLAQKITEADAHHLIGKYQKQIKVVEGIAKKVQDDLDAYEAAIKVMVEERKALHKEFETCERMLSQTTSQLKDLKAKAEKAKQEGKAEDLLKEKKTAGVLAKGALGKYQDLADGAYKPGTKIRGALDVKAAKMSQKDSDQIIRPLSDDSFKAFKELTDLKRGIEALAKEILLIA